MGELKQEIARDQDEKYGVKIMTDCDLQYELS